MAKTARAELFDADNDASVRDFVDNLIAESKPWRDHMTLMDDVLHNRHTIPTIPGAPMTMTPVYSSLARQQLRLVLGMLLSEMPTANLQVPSENQKLLDKIEDLESASNDIFPLMERQLGRAVWGPVTEAQSQYGVGWEAIDGHQQRLSTKGGYPKRDAGMSADDYTEATENYVKSQGTPGGQLPTSWRPVDTRNMLWLESEYDGGLLVAVEFREAYVHEILSNPKHAAEAEGLVDAAGKLEGQGKKAGLCKVRFASIETPWTITHYLTKSTSDASPGSASSQYAFNQLYSGGEVVDHYPNPLKGKVRYIPSYGLTGSSDSQWTRYRGIYTDQVPLILILDSMMSHWVFDQQCLLAAPVIIQQMRPDPNSTAPIGSEGNDETTALQKFQLTAGFHDKVPLPAGYEARFLVRERSPEWTDAMDRIERWAMLVGIPTEDILRSGGSSGYAISQIVQTATAANNSLIKGIEQAGALRVERVHDWYRVMDHSPQLMKATERGARYVRLDSALLKDKKLYMTIDTSYRVKRVTDEAAALQNYLAATTPGPNQAFDKKTAHEKYLFTTDFNRIQRAILVDEIKASPEYKKFLTNDALERAGFLEKQEQQKADNLTELEQYLEMDPAAAQVAAEMAMPDQPGFAVAQQYLQQAGGMPPVPGTPMNGSQQLPPPVQTGNPLAPNGGRVAGQEVLPGGPRLQ